jgi:hypothetical protein
MKVPAKGGLATPSPNTVKRELATPAEPEPEVPVIVVFSEPNA